MPVEVRSVKRARLSRAVKCVKIFMKIKRERWQRKGYLEVREEEGGEGWKEVHLKLDLF